MEIASQQRHDLVVRLFGRFSVEMCARAVDGLDAAKVQELLAYLLIHGGRPHPRSVLASVLWGDCAQAQAQKYLRQSLWQLQSALSRTEGPHGTSILAIEPDWINVSPHARPGRRHRDAAAKAHPARRALPVT